MKVVDQDIPAELYNAYIRSLGQAAVWHPGSDVRTLKKRDPYKRWHARNYPRGAPSAAQLEVRAAFLKCVDCFNKMPRTGGVEPPELGYRSREWWFNKSREDPVQNWKKSEMKIWYGDLADPYQFKDSNYNWHDVNWFLKTDEADFISFYNEMKTKYGYPWSAKNDPDQIVTKMNQIVCDEIEYDHFGDIYVCFTPGQTAQARKGVCDDQSALHYALTWKALKELAWTDDQINNRLACVIVDRGDNRHMYNWWKSNNNSVRIVENTYDPGTSPRVIGGMKYWGDEKATNLIQKFDKAGHFEPVVTYPELILPLFYYNYFIKYSWASFYDDDVPPWCVAFDHWVEKAPQLDGETQIRCLIEFNDKLYGGTYNNGRLYEWNGTNAWVQKAPKLGTQDAICAMVVFNTYLYATTGFHGRLYRWNGVNAWVEIIGYWGDLAYFYGLISHNYKLYAAGVFQGKLFEWDGASSWLIKASYISPYSSIGFLIEYQGKIYGSGNPYGRLLEWNGVNAWVFRTPNLPFGSYLDTAIIYKMYLYAVNRSNGILYQWNDVDAWVQKASAIGGNIGIWSLAIYMEKIYGGGRNQGSLYEWNGTDAWVEKTPQLGDEVIIRSLLAFNNKLYGGTQEHGKLYEFN